MNHLLLINTPIIEMINTNQYKGAKAELFFNLRTPTTGAGTSRLKIWLEAKFSLKAAPNIMIPTQVHHLLIRRIGLVQARLQTKIWKELKPKMFQLSKLQGRALAKPLLRRIPRKAIIVQRIELKKDYGKTALRQTRTQSQRLFHETATC